MKRKEMIEALRKLSVATCGAPDGFDDWCECVLEGLQNHWTDEEFDQDMRLAAQQNHAASEQPTPQGTGPEIAPMVIADIQARVEMGKVKYGEPLRAHNGREALLDAYQEVLDFALYLKQALEERKDWEPMKCRCGHWPEIQTGSGPNFNGFLLRCENYKDCPSGSISSSPTIPLAIREWNKAQEVKP